MRIAVISANFGNFDQKYYHTKQYIPDDWCLHYYDFDDNNFPYRKLSMSDRLRGKIPKILGYELVGLDYDYYIWIDSNITFNNPDTVRVFVEQCIGNDILLFKHPHRNTLKQELDFMVELQSHDPYIIKRYTGELIEEQIDIYKDVWYKQLYIGGCFVYSRELIGTGMMNDWFYECCRYSVQDQLSLPYVLGLNNIKITDRTWDFNDGTYLKYHWSHS